MLADTTTKGTVPDCAMRVAWQRGATMTVIVPGVYKHGKVELLETPTGLREGRVRVMLTEEPEPEPKPELQHLVFGKYSGGRDITLEDFKDAEWHGEAEFDDLNRE
jgi:hypothetical protein